VVACLAHDAVVCVAEPAVVAVTGVNGAGKSTLLLTIAATLLAGGIVAGMQGTAAVRNSHVTYMARRCGRCGDLYDIYSLWGD
jgi:ABC-type Mn2+/Zn2+ transport system ATPase subunit